MTTKPIIIDSFHAEDENVIDICDTVDYLICGSGILAILVVVLSSVLQMLA